MIARENFFAGSVTSRPATHLIAHLEALVMSTFPRTRLSTWYTRLIALLPANAVYTTVLTYSGTWRA